MTAAAEIAPSAVRVLERGWVSSNNIVLFDDDSCATLIDSGYVAHSEQTVQLVRHALDGRRLARIVNTHLHSDHCGGNALLAKHFGASVVIPPGSAQAVREWDELALGFAACGQRCDRFDYDSLVEPGRRYAMGGREWEALASPGHDPHSIVLWNAHDRTLISADALWEHGFGAIFPEVEGKSGFAEQRSILQLIRALDPRRVIPGHGAPFTGVGQALSRAFARLDALEASPLRNARSVMKTLLKFHLLIVRHASLGELTARCRRWHYARVVNERYFRLPFPEFIRRAVDELAASGALELRNEMVVNRGEPTG